MQMKFYSPLTADFFPNDTEDLGDSYNEYEGIPYTGEELTGYRDIIRDAIHEDVKDFYGDLMRYYREDDSVRRTGRGQSVRHSSFLSSAVHCRAPPVSIA